ncbi:FAD-binding protein [Jannaschia seohaensis]|uniref:Glycolate oxidase FAD binding subunit n=1 Tax=Jannaschia seohaensis TaxID=475081 RepID=A0A2Y9AVS5_9RHOB|nr:FAD-binding protein [Jannaschia seohaensis]PWJ18112.1 glycolate oxidase FAD binding subunit [Jannaschia seohaensis]SSA46637.1 glycolate oxidase FAD binding subunit [Jannaschia seohaensis]
MLRPESEQQMAEIVRGANGPLSLRGGATRHVPGAGEAVTTAGLTGITLYEPGALTLVARAGTPMAEIEAALAAENQRLPFEPMDHRLLLGTEGVPTIGGAVAMNVSGPRRVQAGACRDSLIGVRFVDGTGAIVKNGGRVMKNVTGYDLVKLLAGSLGTLGVLTEVSFKVLPAAAMQATLVLDGLSVEDAVRAMAAGLSSPFEVTGAAHDPAAGKTWLRIEGLEGSVDYRAGELARVLAPFGAAERLDPNESDTVWRAVRDAEAMLGEGDVWRVHVRASHAPQVVARAQAQAALLDWGGGLVWLRLPAGTDLRARLDGVPGHATRVRGQGPGALPPEAPALAALTQGIRAKFDPRGILSGAAEA